MQGAPRAGVRVLPFLSLGPDALPCFTVPCPIRRLLPFRPSSFSLPPPLPPVVFSICSRPMAIWAIPPESALRFPVTSLEQWILVAERRMKFIAPAKRCSLRIKDKAQNDTQNTLRAPPPLPLRPQLSIFINAHAPTRC